MGIVNLVPPTEDRKIVKTLAFPYQRGPSGFPAMAQADNGTYTSIVALFHTGTNERVMQLDLGIDLMEYIFEDMSPIQRARIANAAANAIERFIPGTVVNDVIPSQVKTDDAIGNSIIFDVRYTVGGQQHQQQVICTPTLQGQ